MALSRDQLFSLARLGAKARLEQLRTEIESIEAMMRSSVDRPSRQGRAKDGGNGRRRRRRRGKLSAAGRQAIAAAQRKRWAKIKAAKAEKR
jgi:hypothetical protein